MKSLQVVADRRLRLLTAALLLTDIPHREQREHAHKVHPLAERDLAGFLELFWGDTGRGFTAIPNPLVPRFGWIGLYAPEAHYAILPTPAIPPPTLASP